MCILTIKTVHPFALSFLLSMSLVDVVHARPEYEMKEPRALSHETAPKGQTSEPKPKPEPVDDESQSYAPALATAYFAPPLVFGSLMVVSLNSDNTDLAAVFAVTGLASMALAPPITHAVHGNGKGAARAFFATLGVTVGGGLAIGLVSQAMADCGDADSDTIALCNGLSFWGGALIGGGLGYVVWGIADTVSFAKVPHDNAAAPPHQAHLQVTPTFGPILHRTTASHTPTLRGLSFGLQGRF